MNPTYVPTYTHMHIDSEPNPGPRPTELKSHTKSTGPGICTTNTYQWHSIPLLISFSHFCIRPWDMLSLDLFSLLFLTGLVPVGHVRIHRSNTIHTAISARYDTPHTLVHAPWMMIPGSGCPSSVVRQPRSEFRVESNDRLRLALGG